jgi:hypothetical protein
MKFHAVILSGFSVPPDASRLLSPNTPVLGCEHSKPLPRPDSRLQPLRALQGRGEKYIPPINPQATPAAVNLYDFLQDIQGKFTLSGQHNFVGKGSAFTEQLEALTGKSPVVWGSDFSFTVKGDDAMHFQHAGPANLPTIDVEKVRAIMAERKKSGLQGPPPPGAFPKPEFLDITLARRGRRRSTR